MHMHCQHTLNQNLNTQFPQIRESNNYLVISYYGI